MWRSIVVWNAISLSGLGSVANISQAEAPKAPSVLWRATEPSPSIDLSNPLVANDLVIVGNGKGMLRARHCKGGTIAWEHNHGQRIHHRPACDASNVYFSTDLGVTAVSIKDGGMRWSHPIPHGAGPCIVVKSKNLIVAGGSDGLIHALDPKTGDTRWKTNILTDAPPDPPGFPGKRARVGDSLARPTGIACDDETIYQSIFDQSRVVALDAATGKLQWSYQASGWIYGSPTVATEFVLVGSQDKLFHCLEKRTGKCVWKFETKGRIESGGALDEHSVFFASCDGGMYRVQLADGKQVWKFDTDPGPTGRRSIYSVPVLTHDTVYFAAGEGQVYALDKETGKLRWKLRAADDSEVYCSPASDGERLFVVTRPTLSKTGVNSLVAISRD